MATVLGKRKTRHIEEDSADDLAKAQAIFQRHFESNFAPLAVAPLFKAPVEQESESEDEDDETIIDESESEWGGVSDEDEDELEEGTEVEIVNHAASNEPTTTMSKRELKAFMSSRPPGDPALTSGTQKPSRKGRKGADDEDEDSQAFLANDLALQRLIAESHILSRAGGNPSHFASSSSGGSQADAAGTGKLFAEGRTRRLTTEMRLERAMGREAAVPKQAKMPMAMRKGITRHAVVREEKRRREAKENGIVLERRGGKTPGKPGKMAAKGRKRGEAPVDMPGVGRMRGAELRLSARDVRSIQGPKDTGFIKKKKKRR